MATIAPRIKAKVKRSPKQQAKQKLKLDLHAKQLQVHADPRRFRVVCCGRRFGKSRLALTEIIKFALTYAGPYDPASPPVVLVGMPSLPMAKRVFFKPLCNLLKGHPLVEQIDKSNTLIRLKGNRPDIVCLGLNDGYGDRVRGLRIAFAAIDEVQAVHRGLLDEVIIPAMSDTRGSKALLTGTPKGLKNHLYDLTQRSKTLEDWAYYHFYSSDNPFIPRDEIERAKATLDPRIFRQEYQASFEDPPGQVFTCLTPEHLTVDLPKLVTTYMGVDFGDLNPAIVVAGFTEDKRYVVVDSWENTSGLPVISEEFYGKIAELAQRWNVRRIFCDPSRPAAIIEIRRTGKHKDVLGLTRAVRAFNRINEGCQIVNNLLFCDRLLLHDSQRDFYDEMQAYHRKTDDETGAVTERIEDGQRDHRTDALRYLIASLEMNQDLSVKKAENLDLQGV